MLRFPASRVRIPPVGPAMFPGLTWTYLQKVLATNPLAVWTLGDASGTVATEVVNGWNGSYSNVTLGQAGIGDGGTSALLNGTSSFVNVYTSAMAAAFNGAAGTILAWVKFPSAAWTDGTQRFAVRFFVNASNRAHIYKSPVNNSLVFQYAAGGTDTAVTAAGLSTTAWILLGMSWDKAANQMIAALGGGQQGTTQTGLGTWTGALSITGCVIGAQNTTPNLVFSGSEAVVALYSHAVSLTTQAVLAVVP